MTDEKIEKVESVDTNEVVKPKRGRPAKAKEKESVSANELENITDTQSEQLTMPEAAEEAENEDTDDVEVIETSEDAQPDGSDDSEVTTVSEDTDADTDNSDDDKPDCCNCAECSCMKVHTLSKVCKIFRGPAASLVRSSYKGNVKVVGSEVNGFVPVTYVRGGVGLVFGYIRKQDLS